MEKKRIHLEKTLQRCRLDFSATYIGVRSLHSLVKSHPGFFDRETVSLLKDVVQNGAHTSQKMSFFLYKEAADTFVTALLHARDTRLAECAFTALIDLVSTIQGPAQRAAAESLGSLPVDILVPKICERPVETVPDVKWQKLLKETGVKGLNKPKMFGRSIVVPVEKKRRVLVIKQAVSDHSIRALNREAGWMEYLCSAGYNFSVRFEIPLLLKLNGSSVFKLQNSPIQKQNRRHHAQPIYAIGFIAHQDYFTYPNDPNRQKRLGKKIFRQVIFRNSWLLGKLTALGILHSEPIPLFHNRVQQNRRLDHGMYEWPRGGRLDRWLESCRYPNFGLSGIRDFEHLKTFSGSGRKLYQHIGTQIMSLVLVAGSYFRHKDAEKFGYDTCGGPMDVREFFDKPFFKNLIRGIFYTYYHGFTGNAFCGEPPFNFEKLAGRMIEEMGVDRHMEEILRIEDQKRMTGNAFRDFLRSRGYDPKKVAQLVRGEDDIRIQTGPHLGGFNERISLPELIQFLSTASALCVAGRYWKERNPASDK